MLLIRVRAFEAWEGPTVATKEVPFTLDLFGPGRDPLGTVMITSGANDQCGFAQLVLACPGATIACPRPGDLVACENMVMNASRQLIPW